MPPHTNKDTLSAEVEETVSLLKKIKNLPSNLIYQSNKAQGKTDKFESLAKTAIKLKFTIQNPDTSLATSQKLHYHYIWRNHLSSEHIPHSDQKTQFPHKEETKKLIKSDFYNPDTVLKETSLIKIDRKQLSDQLHME